MMAQPMEQKLCSKAPAILCDTTGSKIEVMLLREINFWSLPREDL
jgi:hypothetical protein